MSTTNSSATSKGENVSETQALTQRVLNLSQSEDWWNTLMISALVFAAVAAVAVVGTTVMALKRAKQVGEAQSELIRLKDAQLTMDLGDKDVKIAQAGKEASTAKLEASNANVLVAGLQQDIAKQQERAANAERSLLELQERTSWRMPDRALVPKLAPSLLRFSGQRYALVTDPEDPERSSVVSWVVVLLSDAKWKFEAAPNTGVRETSFQATNLVVWVSPSASANTMDAARALVPILESAGLSAVVLQSGWGPQPDAAPSELIRVVIFKKGPRMTVTGNLITFEGLPTRLFFGSGPPK